MFEQKRCINNIYFLAKRQGKRIGDIEKAAGVSAGYISKLNRDDNTSIPGIEFLERVADEFGVTIDTLINYDLADMTPTEHYITNFLTKLNKDTQEDKLDWEKESANSLNGLKADCNGYVAHPLFNLKTFVQEFETRMPQEVTEVVFESETYGTNTAIEGDCYSLRLKNGSTLYVMCISKFVHYDNDSNVFAKEVWINVPNGGTQYLANNQTADGIGELVDILYDSISENMKHPKVKPGIKYVIDAFMEDDLSDDADYIPY